MTPELELVAYRHLCRIRLLDERLALLQRQGRVGFHGSSLGQEAVPVGVGLALRPTDWVFPALRESALLLVRGQPLSAFLAQDFGSALDRAKGRQMPSHQSSREYCVVSWSSAIATQLPQAVGMAFAAKLRRASDIALAFLGDGATSHPDFHAALNFAGVFRVPVVFVCQNNRFAISVPVARQSANPRLFEKAAAYGLPAEEVDGNDVSAIHEAVTRAAARARAGEGATFIECSTYRLGPHSSSDDPSRYREDAEVEAWQRRDPLRALRERLLARSMLNEAAELELTHDLERELEAALTLAEAAPPPARSSLFDDVFAKPTRFLEEQRAELQGLYAELER